MLTKITKFLGMMIAAITFFATSVTIADNKTPDAKQADKAATAPSNPTNDQEKEAAKLEALRRFMNQGNGTIRKPGTSGFKKFNLRDL